MSLILFYDIFRSHTLLWFFLYSCRDQDITETRLHLTARKQHISHYWKQVSCLFNYAYL
jgi:hypothetical protein